MKLIEWLKELSMNYHVEVSDGKIELKEINHDKKECEETNC